ncbi:phenoloxidase-activating factor 2-like isoform X2 [Cylas formicarius]|uniref:phenoloxidase-activating factor 2-like isoform X2 n=1 Tax=Cylas formicarius TaxID=197179 RepID=UPI00295847F2|nr:phenoloxidase-activating factor 2-like isoform X2 [Cylas formicarius]
MHIWMKKLNFKKFSKSTFPPPMNSNARSVFDDKVSAPCTDDLDVCCKVECGKGSGSASVYIGDKMYYAISEQATSSRIMGETRNAEFAEFPWMLGILKGRTFKCGASLIHPKVAVTAAHCVSSKAIYTVRAGEWNWEEKTEPLEHQDRAVDKVIFHSDFQPESLQNDIALLVMKLPFKLTSNVGVVCIPTRNSDVDMRKCVATGWGKNSFKKGTYQPILKKIDLPLIQRNKCEFALRRSRLGPTFALHRSFMCAGGERNRDTCKGDGGSPLMCPLVDQPDRYQQVGIVSWGLTCGLANTPGVYVNVVIFSDWIDKQMRDLGFDTQLYRY